MNLLFMGFRPHYMHTLPVRVSASLYYRLTYTVDWMLVNLLVTALARLGAGIIWLVRSSILRFPSSYLLCRIIETVHTIRMWPWTITMDLTRWQGYMVSCTSFHVVPDGRVYCASKSIDLIRNYAMFYTAVRWTLFAYRIYIFTRKLLFPVLIRFGAVCGFHSGYFTSWRSYAVGDNFYQQLSMASDRNHVVKCRDWYSELDDTVVMAATVFTVATVNTKLTV